MPSGTRLGAVAMAFLLVLSATAPALASEPADISIDTGDTTFTVTVTHNGTAVNDTLVNVTPTDPANTSYAGDSGLTDANGTVTFDLPDNETTVNISTTFNGTTTTVTATLPAASDTDDPVWDGSGPFGQWVVSWLSKLDTGNEDVPVGQIVSDLVTKNNPGSEHRSDKANPGGNGPSDTAITAAEDGGNSSGPPEHAVNQSESKGNSSNNGNGNGNGNAPDEGDENDDLARAVEL